MLHMYFTCVFCYVADPQQQQGWLFDPYSQTWDGIISSQHQATIDSCSDAHQLRAAVNFLFKRGKKEIASYEELLAKAAVVNEQLTSEVVSLHNSIGKCLAITKNVKRNLEISNVVISGDSVAEEQLRKRAKVDEAQDESWQLVMERVEGPTLASSQPAKDGFGKQCQVMRLIITNVTDAPIENGDSQHIAEGMYYMYEEAIALWGYREGADLEWLVSKKEQVGGVIRQFGVLQHLVANHMLCKPVQLSWNEVPHWSCEQCGCGALMVNCHGALAGVIALNDCACKCRCTMHLQHLHVHAICAMALASRIHHHVAVFVVLSCTH